MRARTPHFLTHNKGGEYPREVVIVDTETHEEPQGDGLIGHRLSFGWARFGRRARNDVWSCEAWHRFETATAFWSWALRRVRKRGKLTIYCHNAEFDAQVVDAFGELRRRRWKLITACLEGPPTMIKWRRGTRTVLWLDTLNLWRVPLRDIGEKVGMPKLTMPWFWPRWVEADTYCKRDVEVLWKALLSWWAFLREHDLGTASPTLASQAFSTYRHRFMKHPIFVDTNPDALALARSAYLGGRCECFRLGRINEPGVTLDVNSMYPFVMRTLEAPAKLLVYRTMATMADLERYLASYAVVADVELEVTEPAYPHVVEGRLCFPVGRFRQSLATPELHEAMKRGELRKVYRVAVYEKAELFREFVDWAWSTRIAARAAGDKLLDWQVKIMANSLYGKFGQRGKNWEVVDTAPTAAVRSMSSFDLDTGKWRHIRQLGTAVQELVDMGESLHSSPAIAAHVTSAARVFLWKLLREAGLGDVWYVDTDSLKGSTRIIWRLLDYLDAEQLGGLKVEEWHAWCEIFGAKDYKTPRHTRMKGVRKEATLTPEGKYLQLQWFGWAGSIARGSLDIPLMKPIEKRLGRVYTKGNVEPDGSITPLRLL